MAVGKYPTFQDKYGQLAPQDQTFEQNKPPMDAQGPAPMPQQQPQNPWSQIQAQPMQQEAQQIELAPKPWEYTGK